MISSGKKKGNKYKSAGWQIFNLLKKQPVPRSKEDNTEGITVWESDRFDGRNNFPQQLLQNLTNSPVGSAAVELWAEFVEGAGPVENGDKITSPGETLSDLHKKVSADLATMWGLAIHITYDLGGSPVAWKHMPFESTRIGKLNKDGITDRIYFNPYYGTKDFDTEFTKWFYCYEPDPVKQQQQRREHNVLLKKKDVDFPYPGQVFWFSIERPLARIYPQPFYNSAIGWFQVDHKIQKFHSRNLDNNLLLSVLINKFGDPDEGAGATNDEGDFLQTVGEVFGEQMEDFGGAENGGAAMVNWFQSLEEKAEILQFPSQSHHELFLALQKITTDQIAIGTKTPRVLLGIGEAGKLGDTQEIFNAIKVMQARTKSMREELTRIYNRLFAGMPANYTIKNINPVDLLPQWVIDNLTDQQKAQYIKENFNVEVEAEQPINVSENGS